MLLQSEERKAQQRAGCWHCQCALLLRTATATASAANRRAQRGGGLSEDRSERRAMLSLCEMFKNVSVWNVKYECRKQTCSYDKVRVHLEQNRCVLGSMFASICSEDVEGKDIVGLFHASGALHLSLLSRGCFTYTFLWLHSHIHSCTPLPAGPLPFSPCAPRLQFV